MPPIPRWLSENTQATKATKSILPPNQGHPSCLRSDRLDVTVAVHVTEKHTEVGGRG